MAGQSRKASAAEVISSTLFGLLIALLTQRAVFPLFGIHTTLPDDLAIAGIFTIVSIIRSYIWRRLFNTLHQKGILK